MELYTVSLGITVLCLAAWIIVDKADQRHGLPVVEGLLVLILLLLGFPSLFLLFQMFGGLL